MKPRFLPCFLYALLVITCVTGIAPSAKANEVIMSAGAAATDNIFKKIEYPLLRSANIKITTVANGPVQSWKDLDAGRVQCAVAGVDFDSWVELMQKEGYPIPEPSVYKSWVIGQDTVKVMTNTDVPVASLSREQLVGIFSGRIKNWSEVGGPDNPILVVLGNQIAGTMSLFHKAIMGNAEFTKNAMMGTTLEDIKSRVVRNSGAIGFGAVSQIDYLVNSPDTPVISRPITLVTKGAPSEDVLKMIEYIATKDGQRHIAR
ncbi:MAG: substrate-binding domain-containing protein [Proteobacteria bacterium]|nr:substrate-binding domain-containing protein [Pseudomonadota bacterium]